MTPENGRASASTEAAPRTINTTADEVSTVSEGGSSTSVARPAAVVFGRMDPLYNSQTFNPGFLAKAASGKCVGLVDPWGDWRDKLTSTQQLDRAMDLVLGPVQL